MTVRGKLQILDDGLAAYCPACKTYHLFDSRWSHNGSFDNPSFTPSMHVNAGQHDSCHSFLTDGVWHYSEDSGHEYAGRSIALGWEGETVHVLPLNDLRDHDENIDGTCWCDPRVGQEENGRVIVHNSADGREYLESLDLRVGDIPNHLALVAKHWITVDDSNDDNVHKAIAWLKKRHSHLLPIVGVDSAFVTALTSYFDSFLKNLLDGSDNEDTRSTQKN